VTGEVPDVVVGEELAPVPIEELIVELVMVEVL